MKPGRQSIILEIITSQSVETQAQLIELLAARGIRSTQATLSRDIKDLRLVKELGANGRYHYAQAKKAESDGSTDRLNKIFRESVTSYETAQNLMVIKTLPGLAQGAASVLDGLEIENIVGTIAGDDTLFVALKTSEAAEAFYHQIEKLFG